MEIGFYNLFLRLYFQNMVILWWRSSFSSVDEHMFNVITCIISEEISLFLRFSKFICTSLFLLFQFQLGNSWVIFSGFFEPIMCILVLLNIISVLLPVNQVQADGACSRELSFSRHQGQALIGHVFKSLPLNSAQCHKLCAQSVACFSVNVFRDSSGRVTCELNKSTKTASPEDVEERTGYEYNELEVRFISIIMH